MVNNRHQIEFTREFQRNVRGLAKRYRNIRRDLQSLLDRLQTGELPGDCIPGTGYEIYKVRLKNSDVQKGKSGGYRVIYYTKSVSAIVMVAIYSKSDRGDILPNEIVDIVKRHAES